MNRDRGASSGQTMKPILPAALVLTMIALMGALAYVGIVLRNLWLDDAPLAQCLPFAGLSLAIAGALFLFVFLLHRNRYGGKHAIFGVLYGAVLAAVTLAGIEFLSSFLVPSWPARALRSVPPINPVAATTVPSSGQPPIANLHNSWGMRDRERTMAKAKGSPPRVAFVGDSFVESAFTPLSLPAAVEHRAAEMGLGIDAVNLGVSATGPRSYYYRTRDVALTLSPDALVLVLFAGNDFIKADEPYSTWPSVVDESPGAAVLGSVMPRTNWLLVNRLKLSELLRGNPAPPGETEVLDEVQRDPSREHIGRLVAFVRKHYYPELPDEQIREVISRGDGRLWRVTQEPASEREYLMGWLLNSLLSWETASFEVAGSRDDAARLVGDGEVGATLSWIEAVGRLARDRGVPFVVFLAPVGIVDPSYAEFWKPWPRAYSWNYICDERQSRLVSALGRTDVRFVDLRKDLEGVVGTYRKLDGHWSQKGEEIVANRMAHELERLLAATTTLDPRR